MHNVKRNSLNVELTESLVYVHYNLKLLSHYCEVTKNDRTFFTWDNNPKEANVEDGAITLEHLEAELLGDHDGDPIHTSEMPPPTTKRFPEDFFLSFHNVRQSVGVVHLLLMFHDHLQ